MESSHYKYLIGEQVIGSSIINFFINWGIAYGVFRHMTTIPLWGEKSIGGDTIITAFLLTMILVLIITPITLKKISSGHLPKTDWRRASHPLLSKLPKKTFARSLVLGLVYMAILAPITIVLITALGINEMEFSKFVIFKASFAALVAALVAPVVALCAMGDA